MKQEFNDETTTQNVRHGNAVKQPLVVRVTDNDFQCEVLAKLARLEAKMEMLMGSSQPGRMSQAEERIRILERSDIKRGVYERLVNAAISIAISTVIAMHERLGTR
jgi:hypothetical protein